MNEAVAQNADLAYETGYDDACAATDELVGTLIEDVHTYREAYLRIARLYEAHMRTCSRRTPAPASAAAAAEEGAS
jgi:hypothetical protein